MEVIRHLEFEKPPAVGNQTKVSDHGVRPALERFTARLGLKSVARNETAIMSRCAYFFMPTYHFQWVHPNLTTARIHKELARVTAAFGLDCVAVNTLDPSTLAGGNGWWQRLVALIGGGSGAMAGGCSLGSLSALARSGQGADWQLGTDAIRECSSAFHGTAVDKLG